MKPSTPSQSQSDAYQFPTAVVVDRSAATLAKSRFWYLALACLVISIGLVVWSMPSEGARIQIHFPQGHGLRAEDPVRYRGIDVGVVESIVLTDRLDAVDVHVRLFPSAEQLAVEGTKFWIVRPRLSLSGVSGLETAVGHKYIKVQPGPAGQSSARYFDGMADAPVDQGIGKGIEILLQSDSRHSVNVGSAIHFRGVDIGKILSVQLSADARKVELRGRVDETYRSLITTEAKFWATGGVDFDFSLTKGLKLDTQSLETLARGGVSMLVTGDGGPVPPGHAFPMAASVNEDWIDQANDFRATSVNLRGAVNLAASWQEPGLLGIGKRNRSEPFSGIAISTSSGPVVLYPTDVLKWQKLALNDSFEIVFAATQIRLPVPQTFPGEADEASIASVPMPPQVEIEIIEQSEISQALEPADWVAVRKSVSTEIFHHLPLKSQSIKLDRYAGGHHWTLSSFRGDRSVWHGTPVLEQATGKLVGMLLIDDSGATVRRGAVNNGR